MNDLHIKKNTLDKTTLEMGNAEINYPSSIRLVYHLFFS